MEFPNAHGFPISNTSRPLHFLTRVVKRQQQRYRALHINAVQSESYYHFVKSVIMGIAGLNARYPHKHKRSLPNQRDFIRTIVGVTRASVVALKIFRILYSKCTLNICIILTELLIFFKIRKRSSLWYMGLCIRNMCTSSRCTSNP